MKKKRKKRKKKKKTIFEWTTLMYGIVNAWMCAHCVGARVEFGAGGRDTVYLFTSLIIPPPPPGGIDVDEPWP